MAGLRYPTKIIKSGLRIEELEHLTEKKLTAILQAREKQLQYVQLSFDMVLPMISRQDNITDPFKSDGRCNQANEFYQERGALSNQIDYPRREQFNNELYGVQRHNEYLLAQDKLFYLLKEDQKLLENELTWKEGVLIKNQIPLSAEELCDTIDEVTLVFLDEVERTPADSISGKIDRGKELNEMIDCVQTIVANRGVEISLLDYDILSDDGWKQHLNVYASFIALWVVMEEVKS